MEFRSPAAEVRVGAKDEKFALSARVDAFRFEGTPIAGRTIEEKAETGRSPAIKILKVDYYDIFMELESNGTRIHGSVCLGATHAGRRVR